MPDSNQGPLLWKSGALPMSPKIRDRARARAGGAAQPRRMMKKMAAQLRIRGGQAAALPSFSLLSLNKARQLAAWLSCWINFLSS